METIRILVALEPELLGRTVAIWLQDMVPSDVARARDLASLLTDVAGRHYDLLLLDIRLQGMRSASDVARVHAVAPAMITVIIHDQHNLSQAQEATAYGATGVISKAVSARELASAVHRLLAARL